MRHSVVSVGTILSLILFITSTEFAIGWQWDQAAAKSILIGEERITSFSHVCGKMLSIILDDIPALSRLGFAEFLLICRSDWVRPGAWGSEAAQHAFSNRCESKWHYECSEGAEFNRCLTFQCSILQDCLHPNLEPYKWLLGEYWFSTSIEWAHRINILEIIVTFLIASDKFSLRSRRHSAVYRLPIESIFIENERYIHCSASNYVVSAAETNSIVEGIVDFLRGAHVYLQAITTVNAPHYSSNTLDELEWNRVTIFSVQCYRNNNNSHEYLSTNVPCECLILHRSTLSYLPPHNTNCKNFRSEKHKWRKNTSMSWKKIRVHLRSRPKNQHQIIVWTWYWILDHLRRSEMKEITFWQNGSGLSIIFFHRTPLLISSRHKNHNSNNLIWTFFICLIARSPPLTQANSEKMRRTLKTMVGEQPEKRHYSASHALE